MTDQEKIIELAKMDGWHSLKNNTMLSADNKHEANIGAERLSAYLTSYDAIIPLVQKQLNRHTCHSFFDTLGLDTIKNWQDCDGAPSYEGDGSYFEMWVLFKATPLEIADALLKVKGFEV